MLGDVEAVDGAGQCQHAEVAAQLTQGDLFVVVRVLQDDLCAVALSGFFGCIVIYFARDGTVAMPQNAIEIRVQSAVSPLARVIKGTS